MFENIAETLVSNEKKQSNIDRRLTKFLSFSVVFMLVVMTFAPAIKQSSDIIKYSIIMIAVVLFVLILLYFLFVVIFGVYRTIKKLIFTFKSNMYASITIKSFFLVFPKAICSLCAVVRVYFRLGNPLVNRTKADGKLFIKHCQSLVQYSKEDIEKFKDWLEYRIKYETLMVAFFVALFHFSPDIVKLFNQLFEQGGTLDLHFIANPSDLLKLPVSSEFILMMLAVVAISLKRFIIKWIIYLHVVKFALAHGYYK